MNLKQQITDQVIIALKAHDELKLSTLRMLLAAVKNEEIAKQKELSDEEVVEVIQKQVKTHKEAITAFKAGNREDLVTKESKELQILSNYLPQQLSAEELRAEVKKVIEELNTLPADFGKVMKEAMVRVKGKADGGQVSQIVKQLLA